MKGKWVIRFELMLLIVTIGLFPILSTNGDMHVELLTSKHNLDLAFHSTLSSTINVRDLVLDSYDNLIIVGSIKYVESAGGDVFDTSEELFLSKMTPTGNWIWSVFFDGANADLGYSVAVDHEDNIVFGGYTKDDNLDIDSDSFDPDFNGDSSSFLMKLRSNSGTVLWNTWLEGDSCEDSDVSILKDIKIDSENNYIVALETSCEGFGTTDGSNLNGGRDIALLKFNTDGLNIWSTLFGGSQDDSISELDMVLDNANNIIIASTTQSSDLPKQIGTTPSLSLQDNQIPDGYFAKFNSKGINIFTIYIGGESYDFISQIELDMVGNIVVAGSSVSNDYPTTDWFQSIHSESDKSNIPNQKRDGVITRFFPNGTLDISTYFGGGEFDYIQSLDIDIQNNLIIGGKTHSDDLYVDNAFQNEISLPPGSFGVNHHDSFVTKFNSSNQIEFSTYLGGSSSEDGNFIISDSLNRIYAVGSTESLTEGELFPVVKPTFPFQYPGLREAGYIMKFSISGDVEWSALTIVPIARSSDPDHDGLSNLREFRVNSNPSRADTDLDQIPDGWEVFNDLDPTIDDSSLDHDKDGLNNFEEYLANTDPFEMDTDLDGIPDKFEVDSGLDPNRNDIHEDLDKDGLTNFQEYRGKTFPNDKDTDADGIPDGWEVKYGLNPLVDDSDLDFDNDGISNLNEYEWGFDPNNNDLPRLITFLIVLISLIIVILVFFSRKSKSAKELGFTSLLHKYKVNGLGFDKFTQMEKANEQGFKTKFAMTMIQSSRYQNVDAMIKDWDSQITAIGKSLNSVNLNEIKDSVNSITSPIKLNEAESSYKNLLEELNELLLDFNSTAALQEGLTDLPLVDDQLPLIYLTRNELENYQNLVNEGLPKLKTTIINYQQIIDGRKQWFEPWQPLLTLIQMTQDGLPIDLVKIAEVIRCPEDQAENLLELLLAENQLIGTYKKSDRVYTKGTNISNYIESMLEKMANFGE